MLASFLINFLFYLSYFILLYFFFKKGGNDCESLEFHYPYVTLIVPTYNEEKTIFNKIKNIEELNYPKDKLEVIFVDGCSTDNTSNIINNYIKNCKKDIKLKTQKIREGYNAGVSEGINNSNGEIIILTDAGAYHYPDAIQHLVRHFKDDKIGAVTGKEIVFNTNKQDIGPKLESIYRNFYDFMRMAETKIDSTPDSKGEILVIRKDICLKVIQKIKSLPNASFDSCVPYQAKLDGYRTVFEPKAKYYEYAPATFHDRMIQQIRRATVLIGSMLLFKNMLFKKKFGAFGLIIMPAHFIMLILLPWLFLSGTFCLIVLSLLNPFWLLLWLVPLTVLFFQKSRLFLISFIQSQIALIIAILRVIMRRGSLFIETIPSTRKH